MLSVGIRHSVRDLLSDFNYYCMPDPQSSDMRNIW